jgi:hypothetical protein
MRRATAADLPHIVRLLADDVLGAQRERIEDSLPASYGVARLQGHARRHEAGAGHTRTERMSALMLLVAGPYRSGTNDDPALIEKNVQAMTDASLALFRGGHLPVMGEWFALPLIEHAGSTHIGDAVFDEIFHPISRRLVAKCDGCLRIGGASAGADKMVAIMRSQGKPVYFALDEIPRA